MTDPVSSNPLAQICSCTSHEGLREPGIDCPVHPHPTAGKDRFRKVESNTTWRLLPCRLCGSPAELWQRWRRDDVWDAFGACSNLEDVDGEACLFHLPDDPHFYRDRKTDAVRHWNLIMGPRSSVETTARIAVDGDIAPVYWRPQRGCHANMYSDPPQDCDAPYCGCNPAWTQAIEMLQECGWKSPDEARPVETALRGLYWDQVDYLTLNKLGGMQNHWMRGAREALGMDVDDVRPAEEPTPVKHVVDFATGKHPDWCRGCAAENGKQAQ